MKQIYTAIIALFIALPSFSQSVEEVLAQVAQNNKLLIAAQSKLNAQQLTNRTGLTPDDPEVSFGVMPSSGDAGNKSVWSVEQQFDFPTVYFSKMKVAKLQNEQATVEYENTRQAVLLSAKRTYINFVYRNKMQQVLSLRLAAMKQLADNFEKRLKEGDISKIVVNKTRLELVQYRNRLKQNEASLQQLKLELKRLNGNHDIEIKTLFYPEVVLKDVDQVVSETEQNDLLLQATLLQEQIAKRQIDVSKSSSMPKIKIGVESEKTDAEQFTGPRVALSVPLWASRNRVKAARANHDYQNALLIDYRIKLKSMVEQQYSQALASQEAMTQFNQTLDGINSKILLDKSFKLGNINSIDYLRELDWLYDAKDQALELELQYHLSLAQLYRYQLK